MNIRPKTVTNAQIQREYDHLIKTESHDHAISWIATKLHLHAEYVRDVVDHVSHQEAA